MVEGKYKPNISSYTALEKTTWSHWFVGSLRKDKWSENFDTNTSSLFEDFHRWKRRPGLGTYVLNTKASVEGYRLRSRLERGNGRSRNSVLDRSKFYEGNSAKCATKSLPPEKLREWTSIGLWNVLTIHWCGELKELTEDLMGLNSTCRSGKGGQVFWRSQLMVTGSLGRKLDISMPWESLYAGAWLESLSTYTHFQQADLHLCC